MAIKVSGTTVIDDSRNINAGVATFSSLDVTPEVITFSPTDGATNQQTNENIVITFNLNVRKGSGNITLRDGSASGTGIQTIGVSSSSVSISGAEVTIDPPSGLPNQKDIYVVVDADAFQTTGTSSGNAIINTYNFTTKTLELGDAFEGGFLICCSSNVYWVISPFCTEVSRAWSARTDANTRAQDVSGCTGWFTLSIALYDNPFYACRTHIDQYSFGTSDACRYWANDSGNSGDKCFFSIGQFQEKSCSQHNPSVVMRSRAMRCVSY